jgi:Arc/MetJ-type ribon-helix-helix transcriptional regulator
MSFTTFHRFRGLNSLAKSGTSVYMNRDLLRWIDGKVKECVYRNRSHAIEYAVVQFMERERPKRRDY